MNNWNFLELFLIVYILKKKTTRPKQRFCFYTNIKYYFQILFIIYYFKNMCIAGNKKLDKIKLLNKQNNKINKKTRNRK